MVQPVCVCVCTSLVVAWSVASLPDPERRRSIENSESRAANADGDAAPDADAGDADADNSTTEPMPIPGVGLSSQALRSLPEDNAASPSPSLSNSPHPTLRVSSPSPGAAGAFTPISQPASPSEHARQSSLNSNSLKDDANTQTNSKATATTPAVTPKAAGTGDAPEWSLDEDTCTQVPLDMLDELTELGELRGACFRVVCRYSWDAWFVDCHVDQKYEVSVTLRQWVLIQKRRCRLTRVGRSCNRAIVKSLKVIKILCELSSLIGARARGADA